MSKTLLFFTALLLLAAMPNETAAQRRTKPTRTPPPPTPSAPPLTCTPANIASNERVTYLVGASMTNEDKTRIKDKWGTLTIPQGETERAKLIRSACAAFKQQQVDVAANSLMLWKKDCHK